LDRHAGLTTFENARNQLPYLENFISSHAKHYDVCKPHTSSTVTGWLPAVLGICAVVVVVVVGTYVYNQLQVALTCIDDFRHLGSELLPSGCIMYEECTDTCEHSSVSVLVARKCSFRIGKPIPADPSQCRNIEGLFRADGNLCRNSKRTDDGVQEDRFARAQETSSKFMWMPVQAMKT
jgi:hypothetical protein